MSVIFPVVRASPSAVCSSAFSVLEPSLRYSSVMPVAGSAACWNRFATLRRDWMSLIWSATHSLVLFVSALEIRSRASRMNSYAVSSPAASAFANSPAERYWPPMTCGGSGFCRSMVSASERICISSWSKRDSVAGCCSFSTVSSLVSVGLLTCSWSRWPVMAAPVYAGMPVTATSSSFTARRTYTLVSPSVRLSVVTGMNPTLNESSTPSRISCTASRPSAVSLIDAVM